jgi:predicted dehydrogenase
MSNAEPIRLGLAGVGRAGWGRHVPELEGLEHLFKIVAACDVDPARCARIADKLGCKTYTDLKDLIADPDVELVDIATRSTDHLAHTLAALKAKKWVFLEKPMCLTHAEAVKLRKAARGRLFVRHNRRFEPGFQHIREIMGSGLLGEVFEIKLRRNSYGRRDDWQTLIACGGGQLLNWGPHVIDHALRLLESPVKEIWSDLKCIAAVGDAEDHLRIVLKGANGRIVDLQISGGAAVREPEYIVLGTKGGLVGSGNTISLRYLDPDVKLEPREPDPGTPPEGGFGSPDDLKWIEETIEVAPAMACNMKDSIWIALYNAIRKGTSFPIKLDESVEVMRIISAVKKGTPFEAKKKKV